MRKTSVLAVFCLISITSPVFAASSALWKMCASKEKDMVEKSCQLIINDQTETPENIGIALNNIGFSYVRSSGYEKALSFFERAIQKHPSHLNAYNGRGLAYAGQNMHDRAVTDYSKSIELSTDEKTVAGVYANRGVSYHNLSQLDAAIKDYDTMLKHWPTDFNTILNRGLARESKKEFDAAIADYTKASELDTKDARSMRYLADLHRDRGMNDLALVAYNAAIARDAKDAKAHVGRAGIYLDMNQKAKALEDYHKAYRLDPTQKDLKDVLTALGLKL